MTKIEEQGPWWIPNNESKKYNGVVKYSPDKGATLELTLEESPFLWLKSNSPSAIHGIAKQKYSIVDGEIVNFSHSTLGPHTVTIYSDHLIQGMHIRDGQRLRLVDGTFTYLNWWTANSGLSLRFDKNYRTFDLKFRPMRQRKIKIDDSLTLVLYNYIGGLELPRGGIFDVEVVPRVQLRSKKLRDLDFFERKLYALGQFLTFATLRLSFCKNIKIRGHLRKETGTLLRVEPKQPERVPPVNVANRVLFMESDVGGRLESILKRWFSVASRFRLIGASYVEAIDMRLPLQSRFLAACRAAEAYHREYIDPKKVSFRNRLIDLLAKNSNAICAAGVKSGKVADSNAREQLAEDIKQRRNDYTHLLDIRLAKVAPLKVLYPFNIVLVLLECSFLRTIGFEEPEIVGLAKRNHLYNERFQEPWF